MPKELQSATGANVDLVFGIEDDFRTLAPKTSGVRLKFNSDGIVPQRDLNTPATIMPGRGLAEPFQGNGSVSGADVFPNDYNQMGFLLKLAFGSPATTQPDDLVGVSAFAESAGHTVVTLDSALAVSAGGSIAISGTQNYNGEHRVLAVSGSSVTIDTDYVAETPSEAKATAKGWTHVFTIPDRQPSFTIERHHFDIAESFVYAGCKVSSIAFSAATDGNENTVTYNIVGSKPEQVSSPVCVTAFSDGGNGTVTATLESAISIEQGDQFSIAGSVAYSGKHIATAVNGTSVTFEGTYVAETIASGKEPVLNVAHFINPRGIPLKRINTFAASLWKDGEMFKASKSFNSTIDMGLDTEQRALGDEGYVSEIPEGSVSVTTQMTAMMKSGDLYRDGQNNTTVGFELKYASKSGMGLLSIKLPENKIQQTAPPVDSPRGLSQDITVISFDSAPEDNEPGLVITLVNGFAEI